MYPLLVTLAVSLAFTGVLDGAQVHKVDSTYPELRPELGKYQDDTKCFPLKETWYLTYRSHETDPGFGGKAKCVKGSQIGTSVGTTIPLLLSFGEIKRNASATLKSTEGYEVKNAVQYKTFQGIVQVHIAYVDCNSCKVIRHPYIKQGPACSVLVVESQLGKPTVCDFVFDLLCGASPKYQIYEEGCKEKR